jgi:hypothetical protein
VKTITLKAPKKKVKVSSEDESENEKEAVAMLAKNFGRLMRNDRFKKKFFERLKKVPKGLRCFECSGFGHIQADCGNLKQGKGKAYNATLSDELKKKNLLSKKNF